MEMGGNILQPLISILIATYNRLDFVRQTLTSCLSQSYLNFEVILLDDGSTDGTREWGEAILDSRVHYRYVSHRGAGALAEIYSDMLAMAQGEYIALLDADDFYIDSVAVESLATAIVDIVDEDVKMVFGSVQPVDVAGRPFSIDVGFTLSRHQQLNSNALSRSDFVKNLLQTNFIPANAVLIEAQALRAVGGFRSFPSFPAQDFQTWLALALDYRILHIPRIITAWRHHPGQTTSTRGLALAEGSPGVIRHFFNLAVQKGLLQQADWPEIETAFHLSLGRNYWAQVQHMARAQRWSDVRRYARKQFAYGTWPMRVEAIVACTASFVRWDVVTPALVWAQRRGVRINN